jgi:hypothetical protein
MAEWSHLPNASHIDRIIESIKTYPEIWTAVSCVAYDAAEVEAWSAARAAAFAAVRAAAFAAAREAGLVEAWYADFPFEFSAGGAARDAFLDAVLALLAYDDSDKYLAYTPDQLKLWAVLSEEPAALLLLPAVTAFANIEELVPETTG